MNLRRLGILVLLLASQAQADGLRNRLQSLLSRTPATSSIRIMDGEPAKPIRQARVKVAVRKTTVTRTPEGGYNYSTSEVCTITSPIDVFDLRGTDGAMSDNNSLFTCNSTLGGKDVTLKGSGEVMIVTDQVFSDDTPSDLKGALLWMEVFGATNPGLGNVAASRDLNTHSLILMLDQSTWACPLTGCGPAQVNEYFSAVAEIMD